ncbi:MAG: DUF881 domain-containing protein [Bifidobacteriaceae bacterium]|jgi:uncharacterized protein YlxW (UPF0749 family)|nr:DUF881 domain-containing protein [Bifidobacteriaceae bacterium]
MSQDRPPGAPADRAPPPAGRDRPVRPAEGTAAWRRLGRAVRPRWSKAQLTAGLLCLVLGFGAATQVKQVSKADFSKLRQDELVEVLDQLDAQAGRLEAENLALERERDRLESDQTSQQAAAEAARQRAQVQGILAGTIAAQGPGIALTVYDPEGKLTAAAAYLLVDELRNAGAEAISLGPVRIVASTYFEDCQRTGCVMVGGQALEPPYEWLAIGDPNTLETALGIPGGVLAAVRTQGGSSTVTAKGRVTIDAVGSLAAPRYATALE